MKKRILITAGGTGGHLFPAQALAQQLINGSSPSDVLFVAGGLGLNRYFDGKRFPFQEVACSPLFSRNPIKSLKGIKNLIKGFRQSLSILRSYRPEVVVGFGSYYTVPILLAARCLNIPIVLHEANSIPGRANKLLALLADHVGVHFPYTASYFPRKAAVVGLPLREGYELENVNREEALSYYGLSSARKTLLICGGSQGARAINHLIEQCLPLIKKLDLQIIHSTGDAKKGEELAALYAQEGISAVVKPFEPHMQFAWRAADAFVGRGGAATIAEAIEFEVPGILIPYPHATDNHQDTNSHFFAEMVKGGWKCTESMLTPKRLGEKIEALFDAGQHAHFKQSITQHKKRPHQLTLHELVLQRRS